MPAFINLKGQRFGRWVVLFRASDRRRGYPEWHCRCDCGNEKAVRANILRSGASRSCGCLNIDVHRQVCIDRNTTHGRANTPLYNTWVNMIQRCHNPAYHKFRHYGSRGITVCQRWRDDFKLFHADMGDKPVDATLDRIDTNGNYEPSNCRWTSQKVQQNNRTNNRLITHDGRTMTLAQWSDHLWIRRRTIAQRIDKLGWSVKDALTKPVRPMRRAAPSAQQ